MEEHQGSTSGVCGDSTSAKVLQRNISLKKTNLQQHQVSFKFEGESNYAFSGRKKRKTSYGGGRPRRNTQQTASSVSEGFDSTKSTCRRNNYDHSGFGNALDDQANKPQDSVESEKQIKFSQSDLYLNQLHMTGVAAVGDQGKVLIVNDFNTVSLQLKKEQFCIIQRKVSHFYDTHGMVLWCSCNEAQSQRLSSLGTEISMLYHDFKANVETCLHMEVGEEILHIHDTTNDINFFHEYSTCDVNDHTYPDGTVRETSVFRVPSRDVPLVCINAGSQYSLLREKNGYFYCIVCRKKSCVHVKRYIECLENGFLPDDVDLESSNSGGKNRKKPKTKLWSREKIPFTRTSLLVENFQQNILRRLSKDANGIFEFAPPVSLCKECGSQLNSSPPDDKCIAFPHVDIITRNRIAVGRVFYRECTSCDTVTIYDGQDDSLLNMGSYMVGYDVLRSYMHSFLHGRRPLFTFYQTFLEEQHDYGNDISEIFPYSKLRFAWNAFLQLLDIDLLDGFTCLECDKIENGSPPVIICDGTSLSFQKRMWTFEKTPGTKINAPVLSFSQRLYIKNFQGRRLLQAYCDEKKKMDASEKKELFHFLQEEHEHLYNLIQYVGEENEKPPKRFQDFFLSLASPSPVCAYIHPNKTVEGIIFSMVSGTDLSQDPIQWQKLQEECPIIFSLVSHDNNFLTENKSFCCLLAELWNIACAPFVSAPDLLKSEETVLMEDEMSFFPALPKLRNRGTFVMDKEKSKSSAKLSECGKNFKGHPSLLPGIFTMFCPHGICLGFELMPVCESPNIPFTILRTRFPTAPKVVIYDHACSLHAYCLNRDPAFFCQTEFYVDRLHWDNHNSCSVGYCMDLYPKLNVYNSQINEQANSGLKRIKGQLSYMTAENFLMHCSFYLWNKNRECRNKLQNYASS